MKLEELEVYIPKRKSPPNFKDLTGTENEYFRIISRAPNGPNYRVRWNCQCKTCGYVWLPLPNNLLYGKVTGCPKCQSYSKGEDRIQNYLEENNVSLFDRKD